MSFTLRPLWNLHMEALISQKETFSEQAEGSRRKSIFICPEPALFCQFSSPMHHFCFFDSWILSKTFLSPWAKYDSWSPHLQCSVQAPSCVFSWSITVCLLLEWDLILPWTSLMQLPIFRTLRYPSAATGTINSDTFAAHFSPIYLNALPFFLDLMALLIYRIS